MDNNVDISITIVAYNNYSDIKNAIDSIEKYTDIIIKKKIYIVDNGTKITEKKYIVDFLEYLSKYDDVVYIDTHDNLGFGKGHNYIMQSINSKYHAIVNPDIILIEDSFKIIIDYLNNNSKVGMVIPKIISEDGKIQRVYRIYPTKFDMFVRMFLPKIFKKRIDRITLQDKDYNKPFKVPFGQGSFLVIRSELFKKINGFDDNFFMYMEDADLCRRVNQISELMYIPYTSVIHKWEKGSHKNFKLFLIHLESMKYYFKKWKN